MTKDSYLKLEVSFDFYNLMGRTITFYREKLMSERLNDLTKVTKLVNDRARI